MTEFASPQVGRFNTMGTAPVSYGADRALNVEFAIQLEHQTFESERQGKPIYKEVPYIHIFMPGGKSDIMRPVRLVRTSEVDSSPTDPERFPAQWAAFQNKMEQTQEGTPLEMWAPMSKLATFAFKAIRISTVEQLAALSDSNATNAPMEWRMWRDKAILWLKQAEDGAPISALQAENAQLKTDIESLKEQFAALAAQRKKEKELSK